MKLYATVTSERATKGQGGNDEIIINLKDENGIPVASMRFVENGLGYELSLMDYDEIGMIFTDFPCGYCKERENKDKKCAWCGENMYGLVRVHHHTEIIDGKEQDVTEKGKRQKGKCKYVREDSNYCDTHGIEH